MDVQAVARTTVATVAPLAGPLTTPSWGPAAVDLFGAHIPIASMALSLIGLMTARGISGAREGLTRESLYVTGTLAVILASLVIERQPGPGTAVAWGVGIGLSGIVLIDLLGKRMMVLAGGLLGVELPKAEAGTREAPLDLRSVYPSPEKSDPEHDALLDRLKDH